jgi:signal transduction histidine kinase
VRSERLSLWRFFILGKALVAGFFVLVLTIINGLVPTLTLRPLFLLSGVQFVTSGIYLYLWRRRDIAFLGYLAFSLEIALISLMAYFLGPDGYAFVLAYLWPIIMAGWLIGRQAIPPLTALSAITYAVLVVLERTGHAFPERIITPGGMPLAFVLTLPYLAFVATLVWLVTREMEHSEEGLKQRNQDLGQINSKLRALVAASEELMGCLDLQQLLSFALLQLEKITGALHVAIYLCRRDGLHLAQQRGLPATFEVGHKQPHFPTEWLTAQETQGGSLAISQESLVVEENDLSAVSGEPCPRTLTHIALPSPRGLKGILTIVSPGNEPFDPGDLQILHVFGHQLGIALENAQLFDDLQHDRNLLRGILLHMAEGVFVVNDAGLVLLANHTALNLLNVHDAEPLPEWLSAQMAVEKSGETVQRARQQIEHDGKTISISIAELSAGEGVPASTIYVARDITQEAQVERMKSDFVAYVSHELRTPLTTIKMLVRLLLMDTPQESKSHEYLSVINTQVERQARLVSNLLDVTRLEAGKYELALEKVDPRTVIHTVVSACRPLAEEKGIKLEVVCPDAVGVFTSNSGGLEQVLINLVSNAVKFTGKGGRITLACGKKEYEGNHDSQVLFSVQDTGMGMSPEQLGRIFTKFYTVHNPQKKGEGTGLGLAISDMIIKKLGGRIEVTSQVSVGSAFVVHLPLHSEAG